MGWWTAGLDGPRSIEFQRPEGQVDPMAAQIGHRAVAEIPPAIPFGPGEIDFVERSIGRGAKPQVPVEVGGDRQSFAADVR